MKQNEELLPEERFWDRIRIRVNYGYFAGIADATITCYPDGMLVFMSDGGEAFPMEGKTVVDREHGISKKSLNKLDEVARKICNLKQLDVVGDMCDGPSFECLIYLSNGTIRGFHYCSLMTSEAHQEFEDLIRKIVREEFFLRKHRRNDS